MSLPLPPLRRTAALSTAALVCALWLVSALPAGAQQPGGEVRGRVTDAEGAPIPSAQVSHASGTRTLTAPDGTFRLFRVPAGNQALEVRALGFATREVRVRVQPGGVAELDVEMVPAPIGLEDVTVEAAAGRRNPRMDGFWRRRARGSGVYFTRADIERRSPSRFVDLIQGISGATVHSTHEGGPGHFIVFGRSLRMDTDGRAALCPAAVFVDGVPFEGSEFALDAIAPDQVEAIEVYGGPSTVPAEFARAGRALPLREDPSRVVAERGQPLRGPAPIVREPGDDIPVPLGMGAQAERAQASGSPSCGAIVVWTRMSIQPALPRE